MGIVTKRQLFYAWHENGTIRLSHFPADMPYRPSMEFDTMARASDLRGQEARRHLLGAPALDPERDFPSLLT
jgi:hypothetical protein